MRHLLHIVPAVLTWLLLALTLIGGYARYIPPSVWAFPQIVCLALPVLSALVLTAGIAWLLSRHLILPIASAITLLAISPALAEICPVKFPGKPSKGAHTLSLLTYNVHSCRGPGETKGSGSAALEYVIGSGADVVCLQEIYSVGSATTIGCATSEQVKRAREVYPYTLSKGDVDVTIISKYPVKKVTSGYHPSLNYFMYEVVRVMVPGHPVTVINVHLTSFGLNDDERSVVNDVASGVGGIRESARTIKHSVYRKLTDAFRERAEAAAILAKIAGSLGGDVIVCGDFNDVPASYSYHLVRSAGLRDAYCESAIGPMITYHGFHLFFHIDQVLFKGNLRPYSTTRGSLKASDHYPVLTRFELL